jgi:preprotein translocase subunit YajC
LKGGDKVKNRIVSISLTIALILSVGLVGCGGEEVPEITKYNLTISSTEGGSVTAPGEGTFTYDEGEVVNLAAEVDEGHQFVNWTGDVADITNTGDATTTITMNGNYTIIANFEETLPTQYSLTVASTTGGSVTLPGGGILTYNAGTVVNLVASADEGYHFVNWTGDVSTVANISAATTIITMNDNYSITANFEEIPPGQFGLTVSSTAGGSVTVPGEGTFAYNAGTVVNLVATPASGYRFVNWTGNVGTIANTNSASTTIIMNADYSIIANFEAIPPIQYNLTISTTTGGTVTTPGQGTFTYNAGTVVNLVATPTSGYQFVNWTGNVGTVANVSAASTTIALNSNYSIAVNFAVIPPVQYSLTISSTTGGSVTTPGEGIFAYNAGTVVYLVATPASCYDFVNWTGNIGTIANVNVASTTIIMNGNYSIGANLEEEQPVTFPDPNLEAAIREAIGKPMGDICPLRTLGHSLTLMLLERILRTSPGWSIALA